MSDEQKKNDLADALAAFASGEHHEEPHASGSGIEAHAYSAEPEPAATPPKPARPAPPAPRSQPPAPTRTGAPVPRSAGAPVPRLSPPSPTPARTPPAPAGAPTPAAPQSPRPAGVRPPVGPPAPGSAPATIPSQAPRPAAPRPTSQSAALRPMSPNSKARPNLPGQAIPAQPKRPAMSIPTPIEPIIQEPQEQFIQPQPEAPALTHEQEIALGAEAMTHIVEDDDTLNLPPPPPESLAARKFRPPNQKALLSRNIGFKQTLIPPLLTMGVVLLGLATWTFAMGEESPIASATWIPLTLIGLGVLMLVFAVITMLQVRHQLTRFDQA